MLIFPDTTVLVNLAYIQRMDLLQTLCAGGTGRWVERVRGETSPWRDEEPTATIAESDRIFGDPILLTRTQRQEARILRTQMMQVGDGEHKHLGEAQTIIVAAEFALNERVTFVTDDRDAARRGLHHNLQPLGTGDILSLLCKEPVGAAETYYRKLLSGGHFPVWQRLSPPEWV